MNEEYYRELDNRLNKTVNEDYYRELEDKVIELQQELERVKKKELVFLEIISTIDISLKDLFHREEENLRFHISEEINYRDCLLNLKSALNEYKRVYRVNF
jgi:hypothetical protein